MKKELVEQYKDICAEIELLKEEAATVIHDTVSGSADEYPFTKHPITVHGVADQPKLRKKITELERKKKEVERFASSLPSFRKRRLLECVMQYGCHWNTIQKVLRTGKSPDALRMEFNRIFLPPKT